MKDDRRLVERAVETGFLGSLEDSERELAEVELPEKYELLRRIGRGGSGTVYLARDRALDRPVAIKVLSDLRRADVDRFRREARFTARLESPHIVKIYELDEDADQPFIVMQFVDGGNLADVELPLVELVRSLRGVAQALAQAHAQGIVHRDIKPENILVDRERRSYLTDFGIARDLSGTIGKTISREGQIMGTPALMPPEQARGDTYAIDARSDVYAFGATLYTKLARRRPFVGGNVVDVLHAVIYADPPFPRSFDHTIPRALEGIVLKCMRKDKDERFASMSEVVEEFDRFLGGRPVDSESSAWLRGFVRKIVGAPPPRPPEADPDPYFSEGLRVVREIAEWDTNLYRIASDVPRTYSRLDRIIERMDATLAERPDTAWARFYRGVARFRRGDLEAACEDMERSIDRVANLAGAYFELGRLYLALNLESQKGARKHITDAGVQAELAASREHLVQAATAFGEVQRLGHDLPAWQLYYARAVGRLAESDPAGCVEVCDRILGSEPDAEEVWKLRGDALDLLGEEPFESYERALEIRRSYYDACVAMGRAYLARDRHEDAHATFDRASSIDPTSVEAATLSARALLVRSRVEDDRRGVVEGLVRVSKLAERAARDHEAMVTRAELELERARYEGKDERFDEALETLERAKALPGCQNRVELLTARTYLERARSRRARGLDGKADLERVAALLAEPSPARTTPPWRELARELAEESD